MKALQEYTDEELRDELKRRRIERHKIAVREVEYVEFYATIKSIDNVCYRCSSGKDKYLPFRYWKYNIKDHTHRLKNTEWASYKLQDKTFKKEDAPKVGDRVLLRYKNYKSSSDIFNVHKAKIVSIIRKSEET